MPAGEAVIGVYYTARMITTFLAALMTVAAGSAFSATPQLPDNCRDVDAQLVNMMNSNTPDLVLNTMLNRRKELKCPGEPPSRKPQPHSNPANDACAKIDHELAAPPKLNHNQYTRENLLTTRRSLGCPGQPPPAYVPPKAPEPTAEEKAAAGRKAAEAKEGVKLKKKKTS